MGAVRGQSGTQHDVLRLRPLHRRGGYGLMSRRTSAELQRDKEFEFHVCISRSHAHGSVKILVNPTLVEHGLILFRDQQYGRANFIFWLPWLSLRSAWDYARGHHQQ